jgi:TRAP transporter 4TM/12TM fusion protein
MAQKTDSTGELTMPQRAGAGPLYEKAVLVLGVAVSLFHIYANSIARLDDLTFTSLHWAGFALLCALLYPAYPGAGRKTLWLDLGLGLLAVACAVYVIFAADLVYKRGVRLVWLDYVVALTAIALALEMARRTAGWFIPVLAIVCLVYIAGGGAHVPGMFRFPGLTLETTLFRAFYELNGMFGSIARISATFVFMFVLFGAFLVRSGAGAFVIDLARAAAGKLVGGPGFVAVLGSALTGTVTGSAVANTVSTGVITIPLMKKAGFPAKFAAGVEASASTGGQLMPPIMGAGAFVMATYTQIPYLTIVAVSVLPALLYFFSVAVWIRIEAKKHDITGIDEDTPGFFEILRRGGISFLVPMAVLIGMLMVGYTPTYAASFAILAVIASSWLSKTPMGPLAIIDALALGARNMVMTAMLLVSVGLIVMVVETTGIGNTLSLMLADWAGGSLIIALVLVALASLVLGMGLPVTAAYIVLATLSAPALYQLINNAAVIDMIAAGTLPQAAQAVFMLADPGAMAKLQAPMSMAEAEALYAMVPADFSSTLFQQALNPAVLTTTLLSAHMIIFWLSQDSNVTPPVCLTAFAAAAIAKTPPMATGFTAWRIAKGLYIVPILFAYTPFLSGDWLIGLEITFFAAFGIYALAAGFEGHAEHPIPHWLRPPIFLTGAFLIWPTGRPSQIAAIVVLVALLALAAKLAPERKKKKVGKEATQGG